MSAREFSRSREDYYHVARPNKFNDLYVADTHCRILRYCSASLSMMKDHVGHLLDRSDRRQKDVNLNEVFNKLDDLSPLGNTPRNQRYKGSFNIFESIAETNPLSQGKRALSGIKFLLSMPFVRSFALCSYHWKISAARATMRNVGKASKPSRPVSIASRLRC